MDSMQVFDESYQASGNKTENMMPEGVGQMGHPDGEHSHINQEQKMETQRVPTLKREKSETHTLERRKKRVKFCSDDGDIVVATHVFERQAGEPKAAPDAALSTKIKKLLKKRSNKSKCSMETQTDGAESPGAVDTVDSSPRSMSSCSVESMVMSPSPCSSCYSNSRNSTPVSQAHLDDLIWGVVTPPRRSSVCSSVCTHSQDDDPLISSIEDSTTEEEEIYCESCCAAIQEECICDVTQTELLHSPIPPKELPEISLHQELLINTEQERNFSTVTHLSPYVLTQAESPRSITPTYQEQPSSSTEDVPDTSLQQDIISSTLQQEPDSISVQQESTSNESNEESICSLNQDIPESSKIVEEISNSTDESKIQSIQVNNENFIKSGELLNSQSVEDLSIPILTEKRKTCKSTKEKEVIITSVQQKRPCTPTDEEYSSEYNQEPPDPPATPSKRKRTSECESPSVDITPESETTTSPILRAPNVTPVCLTEQNAIKPVATFAPGSARAKAAALLARARAVKAEITTKETSESVNVQKLTISKDNDSSLENKEIMLETHKAETQEIKAETQQNGSEKQESNEIDEVKDHANKKPFPTGMSNFIENDEKFTENIEKNEENLQKNVESSVSKEIDPYQLKEKLEGLENELENQLNETPTLDDKEQDKTRRENNEEINLDVRNDEKTVNADCYEQRRSEIKLKDEKILEESVIFNKETSVIKELEEIEIPPKTIKREGTFTSDDKITEESPKTIKREGTFTADDTITEDLTASIKREGTFTLDSPTDDGPSPPKIVKPSSKEEPNVEDISDTSATGAIPKQVKFTDAPKSPRKVRIANTKNVKEKTKKVEGKLSTFSTKTTVPDKIKPVEAPKASPKPTPKPAKSVKSSESPVTLLRNSARKTIMSAWRKTTGTQDETNKLNTVSNKVPIQKEQPTKSPKTQRRKLVLNTKLSIPKEVIPKIKVLDKSPVRPLNNKEKQANSASSVLKRDPMPKWEKRSETRNLKKFDSEKERLQAEINRINADRERIQSELVEARIRVEEEVVARRALRRTNDMAMRQLREGEARRAELLMADLKNRMEDEKRKDLNMLKEALSKGHEADLMRADRERDEEQRRIRHHSKIKEDRLKAELRSQTFSKHEAAVPVQCCHHDREIDRLNREILTLKENRKKLEDQVQSLSDNERKHGSELRRVHEEHEAILSKLHKTNKTEAMKLLDELRSKERTIEKLEHTVTAQSSKIRLLEERQREGSTDRSDEAARKQSTRAANSAGSVGRKHKDGRSREKDGSGGSGASSRCSRSVESDISLNSSLVSEPEQSSAALAAAMAAEVEALRLQVEQQRQEMEHQRLEIKERRQEMERERQELQATLVLEARERESGTPRPTWPLRRESCVKVCELPTVPEQSSEDEVSPLSSAESSPTGSRPTLAPFTSDLFGACDEFSSSSPDNSTSFLTPITPGTEPMWPQIWASDISSQYAQLSREHQELQKSYQLLASTTSSVPSTPELLESIGGKDGPAEWWAQARVVELETESATLRAELQEAQDQRDLLEFRILELEELDKQSDTGSSSPLMCDQSTLTECCDITVDSGSNISTSTNEDLSLPLSIDSGLDLSNDYKARVVEGRNWLNQLSRSVSEDSEKVAAAHLSALLDWLANHNHHAQPMSPTLHTPTPKPMGVGDDHGELGRDLMVLAARLQESLADPQAQEPLLLDTIAQLRLLDTSLSGLQERVVHLSQENHELHDALQALSDAHETRTEASGTESELVHRKTPSSLHSDLSDSESDSPEHAQHSRTKISMLENTSSFQESGIFDTSCEVVSSSTQTDMPPLLDGISKETLLHESTESDTEINLQTAVARLAIIKNAVQDGDLRNLRISDLQESDEYLKSTIEGEHIILSKFEYDSIVENERGLQQELEHLKCDKDQIAHDYETLKDQFRIFRESQSTHKEQDLRGQMRVMSQQLECSERYRMEVFEEKCELEEAENDARLMVQRLESQIDAAREMENLLSASLSQEQEISRELQRRVRDLQVLEKGHRSRIAALESLNNEAQDRAATLAYARDALATQLTFAAYGLVLVDAWRQLVGCPSSALIPYNGSPFIVSPGPYSTKGPDAEIITLSESRPNLLNKDVSVCVPNMCDVFVQTVPSTTVHVAIQANSNIASKCVGIQYEKEEMMEEESVDHGQRRRAEDICIEDEPATKKARAMTTKSQATMTEMCSEVTDREEYYLQQIESLQKEKMTLRKSQEGERKNSLQQHSSLEGEAEELKAQLREAENTKCQLLFQIEEIEDQRDNMQADLRRRIEELKGDMSRYSDLHELEKKALRRDYEARISEVIDERRRYEDRVKDLELQLSTLRQELEIVGVSIANDLVEFDSDTGNMLNQNQGKSSGSWHSDADGGLLNKIRELVKSETSFRQKITELEKKEYAYRETIREADKIMSSHVTTYKQRIEDLEGTIEQKDAKIQQLEVSEERLRSSLRTNSRSSEGSRISDLLDRLIETENSELKLKEKVWNFEKNEKELQIKLMEAEKNQQSLRGELRDQEDMVHRLMTLETENNSLSIELTQVQDAAHKLSDVQQNESYLRGRVEELEVTENMLRETLRQADLIMAQRERKLRDQVSSLEEELGSYKAQLENAVSNESQSKDCESQLRKQLDELRTRLTDTERDLKESSSETISHESQHRSEVTKMRNQLKLANSQLTDLDTLNCALRDRVLAAETEVERLATQAEDSSRKHEQDLLSLNLQVSCKESRIKEIENQIEQMSHSNAVHELDALSGTAIAALHDSINSIATTLKNCSACAAVEGATLTEVTSQLRTLTEVLEGRAASSDSEPPTDTEEEEPHIEISAISVENLVADATTTSPPTPAEEGLMEHTSGDVLSSKRSRRANRRRTRTRLMEEPTHILPYPGGSSTILDELEEKVRELEEAVSHKEEELRLADTEAHDLHSQLQYRDDALTNKSVELEQLNATLASLRQQLLCTMEDYERDKLSLEAKHKIDIEDLTCKVEQLTKDVERITSRGRDKDNIIATLSNQIRAILRSGNMSVVINQLRTLNKEGDSSNKNIELPENQPLPDFDLEAVCNLLNQPYEMGSLPDPAIYQTGMEPCSHVTCKSSTISTPSVESTSHVAAESTSHVVTQGSPTLVQQKKSRIPRYMPPSMPSVKPLVSTNKIKQNSVQSKVKQPVQPWGRAPQRFTYKDKQQNALASSRASPTNSAKVSLESQRSFSSMVASETPAQINALPEMPINNVPSAPASGVYGTMKPLATSTPAKATGRKDSTRRERSTRFVSDARKIKRMVTGIAPLDAAVDCASAPEWQERLQSTSSSPTSSKSSGTYDVEATCVPRPQELRITRRVGVDGVVIAWAPLEHDCVAGFQVLVGGRVVQHVRSPHRTKALVTGLPLAGTFTIGLVTIANDGRCSTPVLVTQDRTRIYAAKRPPKTLRRAVPTAL